MSDITILNANHSNEPRLPPELEEHIFALATNESPSDAWNLMLVAQRVHHWYFFSSHHPILAFIAFRLVPRIFNVVILTESQPSPIRFNLTIIERYAKHAHHLFVELPDLIQYLPLFQNIKDLVIGTADFDHSQLEVLLTFKDLTRLSVAFIDSQGMSPSIYFSLFGRVTHLDINSYCTTWFVDAMEAYINFPSLTHLCIIAGTNVGVLKLFLDRKRCRSLEVVVFWHSLYAGDGLNTMVITEGVLGKALVEDDGDRIVLLSVITAVRDWENGAKGGDDMWKVADKEIARRRQRK